MATLLNANVIAIDYRGFGDSGGWPSEEGTRKDAMATFKWLNNIISKHISNTSNHLCNIKNINISNNNIEENFECANTHYNKYRQPAIYIYGHSLGSGIGVQLAKDIDSLYNNNNQTLAIKTNNIAVNCTDLFMIPLSGIILDAPFSSLLDAALSHPIGAIFRIFPPIIEYM